MIMNTMQRMCAAASLRPAIGARFCALVLFCLVLRRCQRRLCGMVAALVFGRDSFSVRALPLWLLATIPCCASLVRHNPARRSAVALSVIVKRFVPLASKSLMRRHVRRERCAHGQKLQIHRDVLVLLAGL